MIKNHMFNLEKIDYSNLNPKQQEIYNFQKLSGILADYGFNCIKLADDWQGADFLAFHSNGQDTIKVQLKGRISIYKKYPDDIYIAFPVNKDDWYLINQLELITLVGQNTPWLKTKSWIEKGGYSSDKPNKNLLHAIAKYKL